MALGNLMDFRSILQRVNLITIDKKQSKNAPGSSKDLKNCLALSCLLHDNDHGNSLKMYSRRWNVTIACRCRIESDENSLHFYFNSMAIVIDKCRWLRTRARWATSTLAFPTLICLMIRGLFEGRKGAWWIARARDNILMIWSWADGTLKIYIIHTEHRKKLLQQQKFMANTLGANQSKNTRQKRGKKLICERMNFKCCEVKVCRKIS